MPTTSRAKSAKRVVPALAVRANLGKLLDGMDKPNGSFLISRRGKPKAIVLSIGDYLKLAAPEPEILRIVGEESVRNGTNKLTSRQIDAIIKRARAENRKS